MKALITLPGTMHVRIHHEKTTEWIFSMGHSKHETNRILGRFQGNIHDHEFMKKLNRVRAKLWMNDVNYSECPTAIDFKRRQQKSDRERYERKMGMLFREFTQKAEAIKNSGDLFWEDNLAKLCQSWKEVLPIIKKRYNQPIT